MNLLLSLLLFDHINCVSFL